MLIAQKVFPPLSLPLLLLSLTSFARQHPSLRLYKHHLTLLSSHLSLWQHNFKYSRSLLRRLISSSFLPSDPPGVVYAAHLALISQLANTNSNTNSNTNTISTPTKPTTNAHAVQQTLSAISSLTTLSQKQNHPQITLLSYVLRLRVLV